jgi:hypothetical protein
MKERLVQFLAHLGMGQTKFEEKVGLSRGFVNSLKDNLTIRTLAKIETAYPELNTEWLKTGEGEMLKSVNTNEVNGNGNTSVAGNGNQITTANITEMLELQKGYQEMINRLITIIEQIHNGKQ